MSEEAHHSPKHGGNANTSRNILEELGESLADQKLLQTQGSKKKLLNSQASKTFVTGVKLDDGIPKMNEVLGYYNRLGETINVLNNKITGLLKQHENDFFVAYKEQMAVIQKDFRTLKKQLDEERIRQKEENTLKILTRERDWFREEALKLDKIAKEQKKTIDDLSFQNKLLNDDKAYFEKFVIDTKKENMAIKKELEVSIKRRDVENAKWQADAKNSRPQTVVDKETINDLMKQVEQFKENEARQLEMIGQMRGELDQFKKANNHFKHERVNYYAEKSELEDFLINCIEEVKKDIAKRRGTSIVVPEKIPGNHYDPNFKNFKFNDKKKIVELILSNEKILDNLHTIIFRSPDKPMDSPNANAERAKSNQASQRKISSGWKIGLDTQMRDWKYSLGKTPSGGYLMKNVTPKDVNSAYSAFTFQSRELLSQIRNMKFDDLEEIP